MPSVAIIGGGIAGLAAASRLAERGIKATIFEAGAQLGGRARGIKYKDLKLDNGQHILLGAYRETLNLLKLAGVQENQVLMRLPLALHMLNLQNKRSFSLKTCAHLPAPLHLLFGLLLAKGLPFSSRFAAIKFMAWLKLQRFRLKKDLPLALLLQRQQQPQDLIENLWEPLCLAALNTPLAQASAQVFCNVLRDSFNQKKSDSDLLLPRVDLSRLVADPLANYVLANSGEIKLNHAIQHINASDTGFTLSVKDKEYAFSHVIIACGPHQVDNLNVTSNSNPISIAQAQLSYQPITTIYLQYADNSKLPQAMLGLVGSLAQWVFDRGQLCGQHGLMAVIISAHAPLEMTQDALAEKIAGELKNLFPELGSPIWTKVITEKRATFSCDANLLRPKALVMVNVYLAGDYVAGDYAYSNYPATIEGAVRSGINAANLVN